MREEVNQNSKEAVLDYLISLLDDSNDFSWSLQRPAMQYCFVVWSREPLTILPKLTR